MLLRVSIEHIPLTIRPAFDLMTGHRTSTHERTTSWLHSFHPHQFRDRGHRYNTVRRNKRPCRRTDSHHIRVAIAQRNTEDLACVLYGPSGSHQHRFPNTPGRIVRPLRGVEPKGRTTINRLWSRSRRIALCDGLNDADASHRARDGQQTISDNGIMPKSNQDTQHHHHHTLSADDNTTIPIQT